MNINFSEIDKYLKRFDSCFLDGEYEDVLKAVEDYIKLFSTHSVDCNIPDIDYNWDCVEENYIYVDIDSFEKNLDASIPNPIYENSEIDILECNIKCSKSSLAYLEDLSHSYMELDNMLSDAYDNKKAVEYINSILTKKNLSNAYVSNRGDIDPALLSRILNNKSPITKDTCVKLCVGIGLNFSESQDLLLRLGYTINSLHTRDRIIRFGIERGMDIFTIDYILVKYNEKGLMKNVKASF